MPGVTTIRRFGVCVGVATLMTICTGLSVTADEELLVDDTPPVAPAFLQPEALKRVVAKCHINGESGDWAPHWPRVVEQCIQSLAKQRRPWDGADDPHVFLQSVRLDGHAGLDLIVTVRVDMPMHQEASWASIWRIGADRRAATIFLDATDGARIDPFVWKDHHGFSVETNSVRAWDSECHAERVIWFSRGGIPYRAGRYPACEFIPHGDCQRSISLYPRHCGFSVIGVDQCADGTESGPTYWPLCWDPEDEVFILGEETSIDAATYKKLARAPKER